MDILPSHIIRDRKISSFRVALQYQKAYANNHQLFMILQMSKNERNKHNFVFSISFLSGALKTHRAVGGGRGPSFIPLYHFHSLTNIQIFICNFTCKMTILYF